MQLMYESDNVYTYFASGNATWAFCFYDEKLHLFEVSISEDGAPIHNEIFAMSNDSGAFYPLQPAVCGDYFLCATLLSDIAYPHMGGALFCADMAAGDMKTIELDDDTDLVEVLGICPRNDGTALILAPNVYNENEAYLYVFDPSSESLTKGVLLRNDRGNIESSDFSGAAYDNETDTFYYLMNGELYGITGLDSKTRVGPLATVEEPVLNPYNSQAIVKDGYYIASDSTYIVSVLLNSEAGTAAQTTSLSVHCPIDDDYFSSAGRAYKDKNGNASVTFIKDRLEGTSIANDMAARSSGIDIYTVRLNSSEFSSMAERGYLVPIGGEEVATLTQREYAWLREAVTLDGEIVAVPIDIGMECPVYNQALFEELGLTDADVPTTWREFADILPRLLELTEGTEYTLFDTNNLSSKMYGLIVGSIMRQYCSEYAAGNAIDSEELRSVFNNLAMLDYNDMGLSTNPDNRLDGYVENTLFQVEWGFMAYQAADSVYAIMPLSFNKSESGYAEAKVTAMIINPYSKNREAAEGFLNLLTGYLPDYEMVTICADWEGGVKYEDADMKLQNAEDEITAMRANMDAATDEEEKAQYQALLDEAILSYDTIMKKSYWLFRPEDIETYQENSDRARVKKYLGIDYDAEIFPIVAKYVEGGTNFDAMMTSITNKLDIMMRE